MVTAKKSDLERQMLGPLATYLAFSTTDQKLSLEAGADLRCPIEVNLWRL